MNSVLNIAGYQFIDLSKEELNSWQAAFKAKAEQCELKGTILLSTEGINLFLAGLQPAICEFQDFLKRYALLQNLNYHQSWSACQPFKKLRVRLKKEIVSMGKHFIRPEQQAAPYLKPQMLNQWLKEGRPIVMLDTRNHYEVELGTFTTAIELNLKNFRNFPEACQRLSHETKQQTVVTFCTGGIRCEKAALWLKKQGFDNVYQLEGGILGYLAQCGRDFFQGKCFVFDERVVIDPAE